MKKFLIEIPIFMILCAAVIFGAKKLEYDRSAVTVFNNAETNGQNISAIPETIVQTAPVTETTTSTITLSFIGDCLCATDENTNYENCFNDVADAKPASYFFEKVNSYFLNDDFTVADCENVFSDSTNLQVSDKGQYDNPDIEAYWFKSKSKNANILKEGGIDCVSISNNHIDDYGTVGHEDTKVALDAANVQWGEEGKFIYYKKDKFKIAVICTTMYGSYAISSIENYIAKASKKSDYQIVYFHGGTEAIHEPEAWKIEACHNLVDAGADLIMGDHPHVLQPMETYKNVTIIYSLGNFIFGGNRHPENRTIIYQHTLTLEHGVLKEQSGKIIPCYVYTGETNNWQPAIIKDKKEKQKVLRFMKGKRALPY